mmetsp:Transcript_91129/g.202335  ORF Transcript_91129/g.202335 Transcript_91129/m.202335 type:complete len:184 (-) Transcript_91129:173-724(-)
MPSTSEATSVTSMPDLPHFQEGNPTVASRSCFSSSSALAIFFFRDCASEAWLAFAPHFCTNSLSTLISFSRVLICFASVSVRIDRLRSQSAMPLQLYCRIRFSAISITLLQRISSSRERSCVTRSRVLFGERPWARCEASQRLALASMWFVGSSRSRSSGSRSRARAKATRICQPPESCEQER